jgi:integrase
VPETIEQKTACGKLKNTTIPGSSKTIQQNVEARQSAKTEKEKLNWTTSAARQSTKVEKGKVKSTTTAEKTRGSETASMTPVRKLGSEKGRFPFNEAVQKMGINFGSAMMTLEEQFRNRALGFRLQTEAHQATMRRLLPFMLVPGATRSEIYMALSEGTILPSTRSAYWITIQSLEACMRPSDRSPDAAKITTKLENLAAVYAAAIDRPTCVEADIRLWVAKKGLPTKWAAIIRLTFILGQRIGDLCLLQVRCLSTMGEWTVITFLEGKVIPQTGPFSIHIRSGSATAKLLWSLVKEMNDPLTRIFIDKGETYKEVRDGIHAHIGRDVRCLRRGGLQAMALLGHSAEDIRLFSRHATVPMLMKYLQNGKVLVSQAIRTGGIVSHLEEM